MIINIYSYVIHKISKFINSNLCQLYFRFYEIRLVIELISPSNFQCKLKSTKILFIKFSSSNTISLIILFKISFAASFIIISSVAYLNNDGIIGNNNESSECVFLFRNLLFEEIIYLS